MRTDGRIDARSILGGESERRSTAEPIASAPGTHFARMPSAGEREPRQ